MEGIIYYLQLSFENYSLSILLGYKTIFLYKWISIPVCINGEVENIERKVGELIGLSSINW